MVSSEPGQDLEGEARRLLFSSHGAGDASEEQQIASEIEDEIEDPNLLGMVEGAAGDVDILIGLEGCDNDGPNEVQGSKFSFREQGI